MQQARQVIHSDSHFEWAVVLAQTACEVYVRDILVRTAATRGDVLAEVDRLPSTNMASDSVRYLFRKVTGYTPPADDEWWHDYRVHAQRRHDIVHRGWRVTRPEVEASLEAAKAMIEFLHWPSMRADADPE